MFADFLRRKQSVAGERNHCRWAGHAGECCGEVSTIGNIGAMPPLDLAEQVVGVLRAVVGLEDLANEGLVVFDASLGNAVRQESLVGGTEQAHQTRVAMAPLECVVGNPPAGLARDRLGERLSNDASVGRVAGRRGDQYEPLDHLWIGDGKAQRLLASHRKPEQEAQFGDTKVVEQHLLSGNIVGGAERGKVGALLITVGVGRRGRGSRAEHGGSNHRALRRVDRTGWGQEPFHGVHAARVHVRQHDRLTVLDCAVHAIGDLRVSKDTPARQWKIAEGQVGLDQAHTRHDRRMDRCSWCAQCVKAAQTGLDRRLAHHVASTTDYTYAHRHGSSHHNHCSGLSRDARRDQSPR